MMDLRSVTTGADLAGLLTSQGVQVTAKGGSLLSKLNQTLLGAGLGFLSGITADHEETAAKNFDAGWAAMMVEQSRATLPDGSPNDFHQTAEFLALELGASVSGTIDFARNVVNPIIKDTAERITAALDLAGQGGSIARGANGVRFAMSNGGLVVNIVEEGPDPLYLDSVTESEANARMKAPFQNLSSPVAYPEMDSATLLSYLQENARTDLQKDVLDRVNGLENGVEQLLNCYNSTYAFVPGRPSGVNIKSLRNDMSLWPLMVLSIGLTLADELPDGTVGSASVIADRLSNWIVQVKNIIEINIAVYKEQLSKKAIVLNSYEENFEINVIVNKAIFDLYLEEGGSTEALVGAAFGDRDFDYDNLVANQQDYEAAYAKRVAEAAAYNEANRLTIFKNSLREIMSDYISNPAEGDIRVMSASESRENLNKCLAKIYVDALDRPHEVIRQVVCHTLFDGTDAEEILVNIDNICNKDSTISVRDAGALVVLDYLAKFLVSQMDVARI